jgi:hypothetical protein
MKRCPQCLFIYPDSDESCDFDQTPLELVDDAEIDRAIVQPKPRRRVSIVVAAIALRDLLRSKQAGADYFRSYSNLKYSRAARSTLAYSNHTTFTFAVTLSLAFINVSAFLEEFLRRNLNCPHASHRRSGLHKRAGNWDPAGRQTRNNADQRWKNRCG